MWRMCNKLILIPAWVGASVEYMFNSQTIYLLPKKYLTRSNSIRNYSAIDFPTIGYLYSRNSLPESKFPSHSYIILIVIMMLYCSHFIPLFLRYK